MIVKVARASPLFLLERDGVHLFARRFGEGGRDPSLVDRVFSDLSAQKRLEL